MSESSAAFKQTVVRNLSEAGDAHTVTALYLVYKTIEANPRITVSRLKKLLQQEYFLSDKEIDSSLAGLVSPSLFNAVSRWQNPKRGIEDTVLSVRSDNSEFEGWLASTRDSYPELGIIRAPVFQYKKAPVPEASE